ncbi:prepilin-type N-terminal cleavage/methylation domain-containing protein [Oceanithermus sp.]|uniref:PulJ/GspJ family protein n=1 Tax=Oceanithermus sp. TaxID=2268145 RepID=UPI00257CC521|nr:prepilin-type N-terminal cleavage/methylation domain-containing protein [Oceanithermus sp.]
MRPKRAGFTLIEFLVGLLILGVLMTVAYRGIVGSMQVNADQDTVAGLQAKLRRTMEVFTQELRSAVFGSITDSPFTSTNRSISFALIDGSSGYVVLPHDSGQNSSFVVADNVQVASGATTSRQFGIDVGDRILMINPSGEAIIFDVGSVVQNGSGVWRIVHPGCANQINYANNTLLFKIQTLGFAMGDTLGSNYEPKTLYMKTGSGVVEPLAFDLSQFRIDYVYQEPGGTTVLNPTRAEGYSADYPAPTVTSSGGTIYTLTRLALELGAEKNSRNKMIRRALTGNVELSSNQTYKIRRLYACR